jgi:N-acetylglutamate synthase-like GNAT family acetyltransferase
MGHAGTRIVRARERSLGEINRLIARSKRYWNWPPAYLEAALLLHVLTTDYLRTNHCFEVLATDGALIGFCSVVADNSRVILDNLWVTPELIGRGVGRRTCEHLFRLAREHEWAELWVLPDPPAEGFYRKVGFVDTGERVPSRVPGGPVFSVYRVQLQSRPVET